MSGHRTSGAPQTSEMEEACQAAGQGSTFYPEATGPAAPGEAVQGGQSPDPDWHGEPMIQGILPLGRGVSVPLRKNSQPETSSELSGLMSCHQEWLKTRYFLG